MLSNTTSDLSLLVEVKNETSDHSMSPKKGPRKMYLAALAALTFPIALGMAASYSATATEDMKKAGSRVKPSDNQISWIGSLVAVGALFGGLAAGYLSNKIGRKGTLVFISAPFLVGWLMIAYAPNIALILAGRVITGIATGLICVTVPAYLVEISTPEIRGLLGASFQLFIVIGVLLITILGSFLIWNWTAIAGGITVIVALLVVCFIPESPRWLVAHGKYQEAVKAVTYLQGPSFDAAAECVSINEDLCLQPKGSIKLEEFLKPSVYKPALLSLALVFFQQTCGSNAVLFYTVSIFKDAHGFLSPNADSIIVDATLVIATAISTILMDKAGRKILLIVSSLGMAISLAILGGYEYAKISHKNLESGYSWLPLVCVMVYIAAFSLGFGPIPWLMMAEMSPIRMRSFIGSMATASCWTFVFGITQTFAGLRSAFGDYGAFWLYSGFSLLACIFSALLLPETKGKPFEEIQEYFTKVKQPEIVEQN